MSSADILSQDEIDALLNGVDEGDVATEQGLGDPSQARNYDLTTQERIVRGRLPTLEMLNERFARNFRIRLVSMLRRTVDISIEGVRMMKYAEYSHALYVPTSLTLVHVRPLKGVGLFMMESQLVFKLVDNFFGGFGLHAKIEGRDFTPAELRVITRVLEQAIDEVQRSWTPVYPISIQTLSHEMNPQLANIVSSTEVVVVNSFRIDVEGGGGKFDIVFPYSMIEPIRDLLDGGMQGDRLEVDERWTSALKRELGLADIELVAQLGETRMLISDIARMEVGQILPFEMPEKVILTAEGLPLYQGKLGVHRGNKAIRIESPVRERLERTVRPNDALRAKAKHAIDESQD
ncbi:MAG: flagellar motor switch protein FliM [Halothiobacillus sp. 24-54-40]|nr:MAG: flagellar motor switch protein FliM [Halothiobacillus sp. 35-54-62]OYZ87343.1 MAG: flagellar motor switch protein FliM [Halothiobacillus sp. 24-54-40]OZA80790.1 MAG: flagellar motor switch protein FliM [Halothiobacillus sp. 39-53-45]HQS02089.1 flagellar motor switch protein FliM [Halothiobacillus sp.]HQS28667.1 flagellar motor switch protein FliM [Halothiobacillus sp.]